jgi:hypothetical protein
VFSRRVLLGVFAALIPGVAFAKRRRWKRRRRQRRKRMRHVRRRVRRRVRWRAVGKRRVVVAPKAPRVGWELAVANEQGPGEEVVVVKEVKDDVLVVAGLDGTTRDIAYVKEDNDENSKDLEGSVLPEGEQAPFMESDISEWEEYDPD